MNRLMMTTLLMLATTSTLVWAQAPAANDPHHPPQAASPAPTQPAPSPAQPGAGGPQGMMGGMPMMNMGSMPMMRMMNNMSMMGMMGAGSPGMATIDHVEGRLAFLRTELKITDAQASAWNAFADAMRANAKKLGDIRASMMTQSGAGQPQAPTMAQRLEAQEQWLVARLEGTRTIKAAFTGLYATLSDDQKKAADELLGPHMGLRMSLGQMGAAQPESRVFVIWSGAEHSHDDNK